jgi:hypothetical protein
MANWSLPSVSDLYANVLAYINAKFEDAAKMFDGTGTNLPDGTIRWNSSSSKFEIYDASGGTWSDLASTYAITVANSEKLGGFSTTEGASPSTIPRRTPSSDLIAKKFIGDYIVVQHAVQTRVADSVFYSSDADEMYKNTASGMIASLGLDARYARKDIDTDVESYLTIKSSDEFSVLEFEQANGLTAAHIYTWDGHDYVTFAVFDDAGNRKEMRLYVNGSATWDGHEIYTDATDLGLGELAMMDEADLDDGGMWEFASKADISSDATVEFTDLAAGYAYRWELTNIRSASSGPLDLQMAIGYGATPTWGLSLSTSISRVDSSGVHTGVGTWATTAKLTDVLYDTGTGVHGSVVGYLVQGTRPAFQINTMAGNVSFMGHTGYNDTVKTITAVRFHASSGDLAGGKIEMFRRALN